jgi:hypothetical protein
LSTAKARGTAKLSAHTFEPETCITIATIDAKRFPMEMRAAEAKTLE